MNTLDDYLNNDFHADQRVLRDLSATSEQVIESLEFTASEKGWPYEITADDRTNKPNKMSESTTFMVLASLAAAANFDLKTGTHGQSAGYKFPCADKALNVFEGDDLPKIKKELDEKKKVSQGGAIYNSGTYGKDSPFTLEYLSRCCYAESFVGGPTEINEIANKIKKRNKIGELLDLSHCNGAQTEQKTAILPLKVLKTIEHCKDLLRVPADSVPLYPEGFADWFESRLHDQLSFSEIPDSRFDPAELAFCLEGLLIANRTKVDRTLMERVLSVMAAAQEREAYWRPTTPFLVESTGKALFPVSVEVATSLLRSCVRYDEREIYDTIGSKYAHVFKRYWRWLNARKEDWPAEGEEPRCVGWHSEHVNKPGLIHIWETALVLEFMVTYHRFLQAHVARTTLALSRFKVSWPKPSQGEGDWKQIQKKFEPVPKDSCEGLGPEYEVYRQVGEYFVEPAHAGGAPAENDRAYSMLLYGPPGTGKSSLAESVAKALGWPMITITVSDFLAGGGAQLEARAKSIFDVLEAQSETVILFDEIDNFLLDRDTKRYREQDSAFQFMTPGMLTKINDLRKAERSIFIIATNYENRIDPAIKRVGRIDHKFLLLPKGFKQRKAQIAAHKAFKDTESESEELTKAAHAAFGMSHPELNASLKALLAVRPDERIDTLAKAARTNRLESFDGRFPNGRDQTHPDACQEEPGRYPFEEFLCLLAMRDPEAEHFGKLRAQEQAILKNALRAACASAAASSDQPSSGEGDSSENWSMDQIKDALDIHWTKLGEGARERIESHIQSAGPVSK